MAFSSKIGLLDFPSELLYNILDLCRPSGFEPCALACKRLFDVASSLIADHQTCKELVQRGHSRFAEGKICTDHFVIHDAFDFLDDLSRLPTALQLDLGSEVSVREAGLSTYVTFYDQALSLLQTPASRVLRE